MVGALQVLAGERPRCGVDRWSTYGANWWAEKLRARGVPFVLASAYERPEAAAPALAGVPNLGKPTNERRLLATLRNALRA